MVRRIMQSLAKKRPILHAKAREENYHGNSTELRVITR